MLNRVVKFQAVLEHIGSEGSPRLAVIERPAGN